MIAREIGRRLTIAAILIIGVIAVSLFAAFDVGWYGWPFTVTVTHSPKSN